MKHIFKSYCSAMSAVALFVASIAPITNEYNTSAIETDVKNIVLTLDEGSNTITTPQVLNARSDNTSSSAYSIPELSIDSKSLPDNEAIKMLSDMRLGWNLGNTMDAYDDTGWVNGEMNIETCWNGGHKATQELIDSVKAAGFRTIRIPVSWHNHVDDDLNITPEWMDRVQEIVDYAVKDDLYIILNVHHDNSENTMYPDTAHYESSKKYMTAIWSQVAERFNDYGDKLIFETMNEPRLTGHTNEWWLDFSNNDCIDAVKTINKLNQDCVDTIRATGGNNADRYIAVPGYDCSIDGASNQYFEIPKDTADNKIIVAVHAYVPYLFSLTEPTDPQSVDTFDIKTDTADIEHVMDTIYEKYISKGIPSYIGEFAANNKDNLQSRLDWTSYYVAYATSRGIPCIWWDAPGNMELIDRGNYTWKQPEIVSALNKYAKGQVNVNIVTTTPVSTVVTTTTTTTAIADTDKVYGKKNTDGSVSFGQPIGEKAFVEVVLGENTGFMNGCLGFTASVDSKTYWIAYQWETKKSATLTLDMNKPFQVAEIIGTDTETVTDEAIIKAITEKLKKEKSALLQAWYASDITGKQIDPTDSAAESINVYVISSNNTDTTTTTSTTPSAPNAEATLIGDANCDGKVTIADATAILQALGNPDKYGLSENGAANADCCNTGDGLSAADALSIQKLDAMLIEKLPEITA